jgi:hypothetical protein
MTFQYFSSDRSKLSLATRARRISRRIRFSFALVLLVALPVSFTHAQEDVTITEFLAGNVGGLVDEDGDSSDWIELYNASSNAVNLAGWYLTDDFNDLTKWAFPSTNIPAKGFLIVFASGKDRTIAGAPLHTSFGLDLDGNYLALVRPDGVTVASEFAPQYPPQRVNFSYGIAQNIIVTRLITNTHRLKLLVPTNGLLGTSWTATAFDDSAWSNGTNGVGYDISGFNVTNYKANITVDTLAKAQGVVTNAAQRTSVVATNAGVINYWDAQGDGHFGNSIPFPGQNPGQNVEDFVVVAEARIYIPEAGDWTFGVNSDDGFRLTIGANSIEYDPPRGPGDTLGVFNFAVPGEYPLRLLYYERGGGAELELFGARGNLPGYRDEFRLVGDTANGGLSVRPAVFTGPSPYGYRSLIRTDVQSQMLSNNATAYLRMPFNVTNAAVFSSLTLQVKYDDGFIAYLNGVEVARRNAPAPPLWNSTATASHAGHSFEEINLTAQLALLQNGTNVLAIQGLNDSATSSDFLILAELAEFKPVGTINQYFSTPTPGAFNSQGFDGFVADTKFSQDRGFYETNLSCMITTATAGATIKYTLNGSVPSETNGFTYTGPILITNTTTLRAVAIRNGLVPSDVDTHTYIFVNDVIRQSPTGQAPGPGWPTVTSSGGQIYDYGMDPDIVNNAVWGATIRDDLKSLPSFSIVMELKDLFDNATGIYANPRGDERAWERPGSLELIYPDGTRGFQINCGVRIRGGFSRDGSNPKHAFRFFFRQDYGQAKLNYPLFGDQGADSFDKIDLRTMQNYSWAFQNDPRMICLRDQFSRDAQGAMGHLTERGNFCHLYLNGQYWGLYNTDERAEASYGETYIGGRREDYDAIKVDPDLGYVIEPTDGNLDAWFRLWQAATNGFASDSNYFKIQGLNVDGTPNPSYENLLDVPNLIDYMLIILYGGNLDAPISNFLGNTNPNNWFGIRNRLGTLGGFRFFAHDSEHTLLVEELNRDRTGPFPAGDPSQGAVAFSRSNPQYLWQRLSLNAEFRMLVADHIQRHFFNGGVLSTEGGRALLLTRSNEISQAIVAESARWGDAKTTVPYTRNTWVTEMNRIYSNYFALRTGIVLNQLRAKSLFPNLGAPLFSQYGGEVSPGFTLTMSNPNGIGTIYYTVNAGDPRLRGGGVSPAAMTYSGPVSIFFPAVVRARILSGSTWSAIVEATFYTVQDFTKLIITEIMYNPPPMGMVSGDELEFLEFKNVGTNILDLTGLSFTSGVTFSFTNGTRLVPGQFFVLGRNAAQLAIQYPGLVVNGIYSGRLDNGGEQLALAHPLNGTILSFDYNDGGRWPITPDGQGFSLVPKDPNSNPYPDSAFSWRASTFPGGSPGADDPASTIAPVLINEILTHTDFPVQDAIELYNPNSSDVNIGGWFLSDDSNLPKKYRIAPGTMIAAGGYRVFTEADFNPTPGTNNSFSLSSLGESVYITSGDANTNLTGYSHGFNFGAAENGVTFGRHVISTGEEHFVAQITNTLNAPNSGPRVGPIVFKEIMFHPPDLPNMMDNADDEYLLLQNISSGPVALFDPAATTNRWRLAGAVDFTFPPNLTLAAGATLVVVSFDPSNPGRLAAFRNRYGLLATTPTYGPYTGKLDNFRESVELYKPDTPNPGVVPYVLVEQIEYRDSAPWPLGADGTGAALRRLNLTQYGNDPANWQAAAPLTITMQPQGKTVKVSSNVTFTVSAVGTGPLTYQWRRDDVPLTGANGASYSISNVQPSHIGTYTVMVSDNTGSIVSAPAFLNVLYGPNILQQPLGVTVAAGSSVSFNVLAAGHPLPFGFRWRKNGILHSFVTTNQTNMTLTLMTVSNGNAGAWTVVVTNQANTTGAISSNAFLTVVTPPTNLVVSRGGTATFTVNATNIANSFPRYQWRFNSGDIPGATTNYYSVTNAQLSHQGTYSVVVIATNIPMPPPATFSATLTVLSSLLLSNPEVLSNGLFRAQLEGTSNQLYAIESSADLTNWAVLTNLTYSGPPAYFVDPVRTNASGATNRFYRARETQ